MTDRAVLDSRRLQLKDFYRAVDPAREKNVDPLFGRYKFAEIATAVRNKYRKLPADWQWQLDNEKRFEKHGSVNTARVLSSAEFYDSATESDHENNNGPLIGAGAFVSSLSRTEELQPQDDNEEQLESNSEYEDNLDGGESVANDTGLELLDENHDDMEKYVKMKKAGLPQGAVENCMVRDGVHPSSLFGQDVITMEPLGSSTTVPSNSSTRRSTVSASQITAVSTTASKTGPVENTTGLELVDEDNDDMEKYKKMRKAGLPQGAVENCMVRDGIHPSSLYGSDVITMEPLKSAAPALPAKISIKLNSPPPPKGTGHVRKNSLGMTPPPLPVRPPRHSRGSSMASLGPEQYGSNSRGSMTSECSEQQSSPPPPRVNRLTPPTMSPSQSKTISTGPRTITPSFVARKAPPPPIPTSPVRVTQRKSFEHDAPVSVLSKKHSGEITRSPVVSRKTSFGAEMPPPMSLGSSNVEFDASSPRKITPSFLARKDPPPLPPTSGNPGYTGNPIEPPSGESVGWSSKPQPQALFEPQPPPARRRSKSRGESQSSSKRSTSKSSSRSKKSSTSKSSRSSRKSHKSSKKDEKTTSSSRREKSSKSQSPPPMSPVLVAKKLSSVVSNSQTTSSMVDGLELVDKSHADMEKYIKMQKAGLPQGAVENCMVRDGIHPSSLYGQDVFSMAPASGAQHSVAQPPQPRLPAQQSLPPPIRISKKQAKSLAGRKSSKKVTPAKLNMVASTSKPIAKKGGRGALLDDIVNRVRLVE